MAGRSGIVRKSTAGYTYDFGIAIARTAVSELGLLSAKALTLTAAIYGLSSTINDMENSLKRNRIMFGGYINTMRAMQFAQDKLLSGQTEFASADIMEGMRSIQKAGLDAKKTFDFVNKAAAAVGTSFAEMGGMIEGAVNSGNLSAFVDLGIMTQNQTRMFQRYTAGTNAMRNAVMRFLQSNKTLQTAMKGTMSTIQGQLRRMRGFSLEFARAIVGDPKDPNSFYNQLKRVIMQINDFLYKHLPTIKKVGFAIGQILGFIIRTVGEFAGWVANKVMKQINTMKLLVGNFQDNIMSMMLWLELVKVRIVSLWKEYGGGIIWVAKLLVKLWIGKKILDGLMFTATAIASLWAYGKGIKQVIGLIFSMSAASNRSLAALIGKSSYMRRVMRFLKMDFIDLQLAIRKFKAATVMLFTNPFKAMSMGITGIISGLRAATVASWGFVASLAANPITWIVVAVVALVAWVVYLAKNWNEVRKKTQEWGDTLLFIITAFAPVIGLPLLLAKHWEKFKQIFINIWNTIRNVVVGIWNNIYTSIYRVVNYLRTAFAPVLEPIISAFQFIWGGIKDFMNWIKNTLNDGWIGKLLGGIGNIFKKAADSSAEFARNSQSERNQYTGSNLNKTFQGGVNLVDEAYSVQKANVQQMDVALPEKFKPVAKQGRTRADYMDYGGSPTNMTVQHGAVQINVHGANASPEAIAKEVRRVLREMQSSEKSRSGG